jgi:hypothetical protein
VSSVFGSGPPLLYLSVGRRKDAKARYAMATLDEISEAMKGLPKDISIKYQMRALRKAAKPGQEALLSQVLSIRQVTGNLLASVSKAERKYTNNKAKLPVALIAIGFRRPTGAGSQKGATPAFEGGGVMRGPNRAYHSHLVEYGTKAKTPGIKTRRVKRRRVILGGRIRTLADQRRELSGASVRILSSGFSATSEAGQRKGKRRAFSGRGQYPVDFIATGTVAGSPAQHPLRKAYEQSRSQMQSVLDVEMRKALTAAVKKIGKDIKLRAGS